MADEILYPPQMKIVRVPSSNSMDAERQEIYRGDLVDLQLIPTRLRLRLDSPLDRACFYIVRRVSLFNSKQVEVTEVVYDLGDINVGKRTPGKYYGDKRQEFTLDREESLGEFLDEELSKDLD
jgi:hypothetical protein